MSEPVCELRGMKRQMVCALQETFILKIPKGTSTTRKLLHVHTKKEHNVCRVMGNPAHLTQRWVRSTKKVLRRYFQRRHPTCAPIYAYADCEWMSIYVSVRSHALK